MKSAAFLFVLLSLSFLNPALAQKVDPEIQAIQVKCQEIRQNLARYDTTVAHYNESPFGGIGIAAYDEKRLRIMRVVTFGEAGRFDQDFFFNDQGLIALIEKRIEYEIPTLWNVKEEKRAFFTEQINKSHITVGEDHFYFKNDKLFLWVNDQGLPEELSTALINSKNEEIHKEIGKRIKKMKK